VPVQQELTHALAYWHGLTDFVAFAVPNLTIAPSYCLLGLLSVSGLRVSEARNLEVQDVDLKTALLTIRGTK
jgi:integrase